MKCIWLGAESIYAGTMSDASSCGCLEMMAVNALWVQNAIQMLHLDILEI